MAIANKVLGQTAPAATTDTDIYTVPAGTQAVVSTLIVANRGGSADTFRAAVRPAGATLANQHYIAYDISVPNGDAVPMTIGITLNATDKVTVRSTGGNLSFSLFGAEIT